MTAVRGNVQNMLTAGQMVTVRERDYMSQLPLPTVGNALEASPGIMLGERTNLNFGLTNLLDRNYRIHGSGVDGAGNNAFVGLSFLF